VERTRTSWQRPTESQATEALILPAERS
jgi:hypothetical protein